MKKLFFLLLISPMVLLLGCSSDDDPQTENVEVRIKVNEIFNLPDGQYTIEVGPNDFIAEVSTDGKIKGMHEGISDIIVKSGNTSFNCQITVSANTTFFVDLKYLLGFTKTDIIKMYGEPNRIDGQVYYFDGLLLENENGFIFDKKEKVQTAAIAFDYSHAEKIRKHLSDRYNLVSTPDDSEMYIDSNDTDKFNTLVVVEVSDDGEQIALYYYPNNSGSGINPQKVDIMKVPFNF